MASKSLMSSTSSLSSNDTFTRGLAAAALALGLLAPGCVTEPSSVDNNTTNVIVQVVSMGAQPVNSSGPGQTVTDLFSDVCDSSGGIGGTSGCGVFNDNGVVTMRVIPKDSTRTIGEIDGVVFTRYRVTFIRADGRNTPGVDVPYPFDGAANFLVPADGSDVERPFIVVRHQAKSESPLREIQGNFAARLSVIAQVDFYGTDSAGRSIMVTGYLNITFSDFA